MNLKHLTYDFEMKEIKEDGEFFSFEGYGATFGNVDHGGDMIVQGAFTKTLLKNRTIPVLYQHNSREPVGIYSELKEDAHGLYVKGRLPKSDSFVRDRIIPQMKVGSISKMSIGYTVVDRVWDGDVRVLKEIDLFEISLVTFPMNDQANITGMKSIFKKDDIEKTVKTIRQAEELLKDAGFTQRGAKAMISVIRSVGETEDKKTLFLKTIAKMK